MTPCVRRSSLIRVRLVVVSALLLDASQLLCYECIFILFLSDAGSPETPFPPVPGPAPAAFSSNVTGRTLEEGALSPFLVPPSALASPAALGSTLSNARLESFRHSVVVAASASRGSLRQRIAELLLYHVFPARTAAFSAPVAAPPPPPPPPPPPAATSAATAEISHANSGTVSAASGSSAVSGSAASMTAAAAGTIGPVQSSVSLWDTSFLQDLIDVGKLFDSWVQKVRPASTTHSDWTSELEAALELLVDTATFFGIRETAKPDAFVFLAAFLRISE
jgi:hypothetical protein